MKILSYHANENVNLLIENVTHIKSEIMRNANVSAKIQKNHNACKKILYLEP